MSLTPKKLHAGYHVGEREHQIVHLDRIIVQLLLLRNWEIHDLWGTLPHPPKERARKTLIRTPIRQPIKTSIRTP